MVDGLMPQRQIPTKENPLAVEDSAEVDPQLQKVLFDRFNMLTEQELDVMEAHLHPQFGLLLLKVLPELAPVVLSAESMADVAAGIQQEMQANGTWPGAQAEPQGALAGM